MNKKRRNILVINSGSATLKFALYTYPKLTKAVSGIVERIGLPDSFFEYSEARKDIVHISYPQGVKNHSEALALVIGGIEFTGQTIDFIGHRVVHGGEKYSHLTEVTDDMIRELEKISNLAPLHNPANVAGIKACRRLLPAVRNFAHFDTAFYRTLKPAQYLYALPYKYYRQYKIRRYGFHGLSHNYIAEEAARKLKKPLNKLNAVSCHLGSGCSLTAIKSGKAFDTTMGFTPLEGLVMATRSGDLDPAVVNYLAKRLKINTAAVIKILNRQSGWLGLSGISSDLRDVLIAAGRTVPGYKLSKRFNRAEKQRSKIAIDVFVYRVQRFLSAYLGLLPSVDAVIFTAGVGERNALIRRMILSGVKLDKKTKILVIPADEEFFIARSLKSVIKDIK